MAVVLCKELPYWSYSLGWRVHLAVICSTNWTESSETSFVHSLCTRHWGVTNRQEPPNSQANGLHVRGHTRIWPGILGTNEQRLPKGILELTSYIRSTAYVGNDMLPKTPSHLQSALISSWIDIGFKRNRGRFGCSPW